MRFVSLLAVLLLSAPSGVLLAQDQYVLIVEVSEPVDSLTQEQLREIFLGTTQLWHQVKAHPAYVKPESKSERERFQRLLGITYRQFQRYWLQKTFAGTGSAPAGFGSPQAVIEFVCTTRGSVGIIPASFAKGLERCKILPLV